MRPRADLPQMHDLPTNGLAVVQRGRIRLFHNPSQNFILNQGLKFKCSQVISLRRRKYVQITAIPEC